jgi:hypothetical protein
MNELDKRFLLTVAETTTNKRAIKAMLKFLESKHQDCSEEIIVAEFLLSREIEFLNHLRNNDVQKFEFMLSELEAKL